MFKYFVYLAASFLIIGGAFFLRSLEPAQLILFVSVCMSAARFIVLPATDFRYGLWMVVGTISLSAVFIDELLSKFGNRSGPNSTAGRS